MDTAGSRLRRAGSVALRLAWVNPRLERLGTDPSPGPEVDPARTALRLVPHVPVPTRPVKLDLAIERHLTGADGLTRDQFLLAFSGGRGTAP